MDKKEARKILGVPKQASRREIERKYAILLKNTGRRSFRESSMNRIRQKKTSRIQLRLVTETLQAMIRRVLSMTLN